MARRRSLAIAVLLAALVCAPAMYARADEYPNHAITLVVPYPPGGGVDAMLDESDVPPAIREEIFERYTFCLPEGELFLAYPVPGRNNETQPGRRAYNIVWYRPTDRETTLADLCTDATGRRHGTAIPPPLIRPEVTAAIKATARALVAPQVAEIFARTPQPFFQPIFDLESQRIVFGRAALLGDAAFVARPHGNGRRQFVPRYALPVLQPERMVARDQ